MPRYVDLTLSMNSEMRGVSFEEAREKDKDGWNARMLHLYSHAGTHMDAPSHFGIEGPSIDMFSIDECQGEAVVVDLNGIKAGALIEVDDLGAAKELIAPGNILLLKTGWSQYVYKEVYRNGLPRISEALARWCVNQKVKMIGVEPPSIADVNNIEELTLIHTIFLKAGVRIVEGLCNLDALTREKVHFFAVPLRIEGGDGAPCRAFAIEDY